MKIILITQGESKITEELFSSHYEIIGIVESAPRSKKNKLQKFCFKLITFLLKNIFKRNKGLKNFAEKRKTPYFYLSKQNYMAFDKWIEKLNPDLIVVNSMSQLLKESTIQIPTKGIINIHPSYLPDYRGANPLFWVYFDNCNYTGATVHYIDKGEDTGDIILREKVLIKRGISSSELEKEIKVIGKDLIIKAIELIDKDLVNRSKQELSQTVRASNIKKHEYPELIDKTWSVERTWHFFRGTESYLPLLFKGIKDKLFLDSIEVLNFTKTNNNNLISGQIYQKNKCFYACKDGFILFKLNYSYKKIIKILIELLFGN
ncbi:MAG: formyltransferase family protein [bacterium]